jgi:hypothetical protein
MLRATFFNQQIVLPMAYPYLVRNEKKRLYKTTTLVGKVFFGCVFVLH